MRTRKRIGALALAAASLGGGGLAVAPVGPVNATQMIEGGTWVKGINIKVLGYSQSNAMSKCYSKWRQITTDYRNMGYHVATVVPCYVYGYGTNWAAEAIIQIWTSAP